MTLKNIEGYGKVIIDDLRNRIKGINHARIDAARALWESGYYDEARELNGMTLEELLKL